MNKTNKHILLTGGTGLIGQKLTQQLLNTGYIVSHLSRSPGSDARIKTFKWDIDKGQIDENCLDGVDVIVHLAGAGVADKHWTARRKKEIVDSRIKSIELIYELLRNKQHKVNAVISASATGYYGDRGAELLTEISPPGNDFLAKCCIVWEDAVDTGKELDLRIVILRTGVVLNKKGALAKMGAPIKLGLGSPLGNGKQCVPWIHSQDVIDMYQYALENEEIAGVYNMAAPTPVTNKQLTQAIAKQLDKPLWLPPVPSFILKVLLGEMASIVLASTKVSVKEIENAGFQFKYPDVEPALKDIYG
ncbi:MAG TPA: TIGR01777 family oxidoreductase [Mucilaginibacter sp.]